MHRFWTAPRKCKSKDRQSSSTKTQSSRETVIQVIEVNIASRKRNLALICGKEQTDGCGWLSKITVRK